MKTPECISELLALGITYDDALALRRISMTLHRWYELECGVEGGCIERDEITGKCLWYNSYSGKRTPTPDREAGAIRRIAKILARYPSLHYYLQTDPRGASLYVGTEPLDQCNYSSKGKAVYK